MGAQRELSTQTSFDQRAAAVLGDGADPMSVVEARLRQAFPEARAIAWEGDAETFQFTYVSPSALELLGHPLERWTGEPTFWADHVVVPDDRSEAIAYCALATAKRADHVFEYRARAADGSTLVLRDLVRVVLGKKGIAERLRGLMVDITPERPAAATLEEVRARQWPPRDELEARL